MNTQYRILVAAFALALVTTACGTVKLPVTKIETGANNTVDIQVPIPKEQSTGVVLNLEFIAGELKLTPGGSGYLATGTATFNVPEFEPVIETNGPSSILRQGNLDIEGIPTFDDNVINKLDLKLSNTPMSLDIKAGAYTGIFELGGLSLEKLTISDGGSDLTGSFSAPNQVEMSSFTYSTGASKTVLKGLANANFEQLTFNSGAGDYTFSFDGDLKRDANVMIDTGMSTVTLIIPDDTNVQVTFEGGLASVNADSGWKQNDNAYSLSGNGPTITIKVKMGTGTLNLKTE